MNEVAEKVRILFVSDNNLFRQCLASALQAADPSLVVDCLGPEQDAVIEAKELQPAVVIIDLNLGPETALQLTAEVTRQYSAIPILTIGLPKSEGDILTYLEAGATEYVSKEESLRDLSGAISRALRGDTKCPPELARAAFSRLQELSRQRSRLDILHEMVLTRRESEILELIAAGLSNKEIAKELHLSLHTVKNHVHRILDKLEVKNRYEAIRFAHKSLWFREHA